MIQSLPHYREAHPRMSVSRVRVLPFTNCRLLGGLFSLGTLYGFFNHGEEPKLLDSGFCNFRGWFISCCTTTS